MSSPPRLRRLGAVIAVLFLLLSVPMASLATAEAGAAAASHGGSRPLTADEVERYQGLWGLREEEVDYNVLVNGFGTGLAPPSEDSYARMVVKEAAGLMAFTALPAAVDLSDDPWFPAVGNQGTQGSCSAWALAYYCYGYQEAKDNGWTDAKTNPAHQISPAWGYNMVSGGKDSGSWMGDVGEVLCDWGAATMAAMPYLASDHSSWGSEEAFREAPLHRADEVFTIPYQGDATIAELKELLASGVPVTFAMTSSNIQKFTGNYILSSSEYTVGKADHAQTLVGYDDALQERGETGAFKVVNSWGESSGDDGFYWLTYDAIKKIGVYGNPSFTYVTDRPSYDPSLVAVWHFDPAPRQSAAITVSVAGSSADPITPFYKRDGNAGGVSMPSFLVLDLTDLDAYLGLSFKLSVGGSGKISSLRLELYNDYVPGRPSELSVLSPSVPVTLPGAASVSLSGLGAISLAAAVDNPALRFTTGGTARWTAVRHESSSGPSSAQSGDIATGASWMSTTLIGPGDLSFDWRIDPMGYPDALSFCIDGDVILTIDHGYAWLTETVSIPGGVHEVSWSYSRSGNGGGSGFVDKIMWGDQIIRADSDEELIELAEILGWPGGGDAHEPITASGLTLSQSAGGLYLGNTTLHFLLLDSAIVDATNGAGVHLYNATNIVVRDCNISGSSNGLLIERSSVVLEGVELYSNDVGIMADGSSISISSSLFRLNAVGLDAADCSGTIAGNVFDRSSGPAVRISSIEAMIYRNLFMNNGVGPSPQAVDLAGASWSFEGEGNHWSDWTADADGDGMADGPYDLGAASDPHPFAAVASPPRDLSVHASEGKAVLSWSEPAFLPGRGEVRYEVERSGPTGTVTLSTAVGAQSIIDAGVSEGAVYTYRVRAAIDLGEGSWSTLVPLDLPDLTAPELVIKSPSHGSWQRSKVSISWIGQDHGSGLDRYEVRMDGGMFDDVGLGTSYSYSGLGAGTHTLTVRAYDLAGNWAERSATFKVDLTAPVITMLSPANGAESGPEAEVNITVTDQGSGVKAIRVWVDGTLFGTYAGPRVSFTCQLEDGPHTLSVTSLDAAGNSATERVEFFVATSPSLYILSPEVGAINRSDIQFTCALVGQPGTAWAKVRIDGGQWYNLTEAFSHTFIGLSEGSHIIEARGWNDRGWSESRSVEVFVDTLPPSAWAEVGEDGEVRVHFSEPVDQANTTCIVPFDHTPLWEGSMLVLIPDDLLERSCIITVWTSDMNGNPCELELKISVKGWVTGTILGPDGPISGARVIFDDGTEVLTDANGTFTAQVEAGDRSFTVKLGEGSYGTYSMSVLAAATSDWGTQVVGRPDLIAQPFLPAAIAAVIVLLLLAAVVVVRRRA